MFSPKNVRLNRKKSPRITCWACAAYNYNNDSNNDNVRMRLHFFLNHSAHILITCTANLYLCLALVKKKFISKVHLSFPLVNPILGNTFSVLLQRKYLDCMPRDIPFNVGGLNNNTKKRLRFEIKSNYNIKHCTGTSAANEAAASHYTRTDNITVFAVVANAQFVPSRMSTAARIRLVHITTGYHSKASCMTRNTLLLSNWFINIQGKNHTYG